MNTPQTMALDGSGNLYVADYNNCRVLQFKPPFTIGMAATLAVGQAAGATNLTTNVCLNAGAATATGLSGTRGMAVDSAGNLWVSDYGNNRVLKYPAPITAGEAATVVLGQTNLVGQGSANQGLAAPTAATFNLPSGLAFDSTGNLWVADEQNNRVLMYPPAAQVTNGAATVELGQPAATAFTSNTANNGGVSATSLSSLLKNRVAVEKVAEFALEGVTKGTYIQTRVTGDAIDRNRRRAAGHDGSTHPF
jgi:hypothetical protein